MQVTQVQLKMIAFILIPVFFIVSVLLPYSATTFVIQALVVVAATAVIYTGWRMEKRETAGDTEDLLALPPKTPPRK